MTLIRSSKLPHLFHPDTASKYGINVAVIQMAVIDLSINGDGSYKDVSLIELLERCNYLSKDEIEIAYAACLENNLIKEV